MIVQLIGTKYVQICEGVWLRRTHKVPPLFGTDGRMDMNPMSPVRGIRSAGDNNVICNVYHKNNVFLIVQGVAKDFAPYQGHVYDLFKGIVTYLQPITFILRNYIL